MCSKQLPAKSNQDDIKCLEKEEAKYIDQDVGDLPSESPMELGLFKIKAVANQSNGGIFVTPEVNDITILMELDTGA